MADTIAISRLARQRYDPEGTSLATASSSIAMKSQRRLASLHQRGALARSLSSRPVPGSPQSERFEPESPAPYYCDCHSE